MGLGQTLRTRLAALISLNALFVLLALQTVGGTAAELTDVERSGSQTISARQLDLVPGADGTTDLALSLTDLVPGATQSQTFTLNNAGPNAATADVYLWIVPNAGFPFCPSPGVQPIDVTLNDSTATPQTINLCALVTPYKISDNIGSGSVSHTLTFAVAADAVPADWKDKSGSAVLKVYATQAGAPVPGPVLP